VTHLNDNLIAFIGISPYVYIL